MTIEDLERKKIRGLKHLRLGGGELTGGQTDRSNEDFISYESLWRGRYSTDIWGIKSDTYHSGQTLVISALSLLQSFFFFFKFPQLP